MSQRRRLRTLNAHICSPNAGSAAFGPVAPSATAAGSSDTCTLINNKTGKKVDIDIVYDAFGLGTINATKFFSGAGVRSYDPAYMNTCNCTSTITYLDGEKGQLLYRGIPIEQLAEKSDYLESAFLVMFGELPTADQSASFRKNVMAHTAIHEDLKRQISNFRYDAHPMGMMVSLMSAMGTLYPEANPALAGQDVYSNHAIRTKQIYRIMGNAITLAAATYRNRIGRPIVDPVPGMKYSELFLYMMSHDGSPNYRPNPVLVEALDLLFMLHADHEQNCSTSAMRHLTSSGVDVFSAAAGAAGALYGPSHGGANEAVLRMLDRIASSGKTTAEFVQGVKDGKEKLMGFGHRVYKNYDPRARQVKAVAEKVFSVTGREDLISIAEELEQAALTDEYFIKRKLYPNVDFYSGVIYKAMGFPTDMFVVLFMIPRLSGWLAHWVEQLDDKEGKIVRPRQIYAGYTPRDYDEAKKKTVSVSTDYVGSAGPAIVQAAR